MELKVDIISSLDLSPATIKAMDKDVRDLILGEIEKDSNLAAEDIKGKLFPHQSKGRKYKSRKPEGGVHYASVAGFPPNEDTGTLGKNVKVTRTPLDIAITSSAKNYKGSPYAVYLETGTKKMQPRPYFFQTIADRLRIIFKTTGEGIMEKGRALQLQFAIKNHLASKLVRGGRKL